MAEWLGLRPAPGRPRLLRLWRHQAGAPRPLRRQEGLHLRLGDCRAGPPLGHLRQAPHPLLDRLHRQRRGAVRPDEGVREGPLSQRHFGLLLGLAADRQWSLFAVLLLLLSVFMFISIFITVLSITNTPIFVLKQSMTSSLSSSSS